jgi:hypothetical protein
MLMKIFESGIDKFSHAGYNLANPETICNNDFLGLMNTPPPRRSHKRKLHPKAES